MAKKSVTATLDALLAAADAPAVVVKTEAPTADKKNGTVKNAVKATVPDQIKVQRGTVSTGPINVPGFTLIFEAGTLAASVKPTVQRATTNPWYDVILYLNAQVPGYITVRREDASVKSPVAQIKSARNRALDGDVKNAGKMAVKSDATEKGVWYILRRP